MCWPPCPLQTEAERPAWVAQVRSSPTPLGQLLEAYDTEFVSQFFHGEGPAFDTAQAVMSADSIALVRVLGQDLDAAWSNYPTSTVIPAGLYFGAAGHTQLTVEQMLKGAPQSMSPFLSLPFFIAAGRNCQPVVALGATFPILRYPVFRDEEAVIFAGRPFGTSVSQVFAVIPITQGHAGRAGISEYRLS